MTSSQSTNGASKTNLTTVQLSSSITSSSTSTTFTGATKTNHTNTTSPTIITPQTGRNWIEFLTGERTYFATFLRLVALMPLPLFILILTQVVEDMTSSYAIFTIKYPIAASALGIIYFSRSFSYVTKKQNPGNGLCLNCCCSPCINNSFEIFEIIVISVGTTALNTLNNGTNSKSFWEFFMSFLIFFVMLFMSLPLNLLIKQIRVAQKASITGYFASLAIKFFIATCVNMILIFYSGLILSHSEQIYGDGDGEEIMKNTSSYNYTLAIHSAVHPAINFDVLVISGLTCLWVFLDAMFVGRGMIRKNQNGSLDEQTLQLFAKKHMILAMFLIAMWTLTACFCIADLLINGNFLSLPPPVPTPNHPLNNLPSVCYGGKSLGNFQFSCRAWMKVIYAGCGYTFIVIIVYEVVPWKTCCCNNKASHDLLGMGAQTVNDLLDREQQDILKSIILQKRGAREIQPVDARYIANNMKMGDGIKAAGSLAQHMGITDGDDFVTSVMKVQGNGYVEAIRSEVMDHPKFKDPLPEWDQPLHIQQDSTLPKMTLETWFNYILYEPASEMTFDNTDSGIRDQGHTGWYLKDFCDHDTCGLKMAHVLALRLYTTKIFRFINNPLREEITHPMPATVLFLQEGLKLLRTNAKFELQGSTSLWRGFKNLHLQQKFLETGVTELAPMSTSTKLDIAAQYSTNGAAGESALIMKLKIDKNNFMSFGAGLKWLSAFPGEHERLFPPLTFLRPSDHPIQTVKVEGVTFTIVEVVPQLN